MNFLLKLLISPRWKKQLNRQVNKLSLQEEIRLVLTELGTSNHTAQVLQRADCFCCLEPLSFMIVTLLAIGQQKWTVGLAKDFNYLKYALHIEIGPWYTWPKYLSTKRHGARVSSLPYDNVTYWFNQLPGSWALHRPHSLQRKYGRKSDLTISGLWLAIAWSLRSVSTSSIDSFSDPCTPVDTYSNDTLFHKSIKNISWPIRIYIDSTVHLGVSGEILQTANWLSTFAEPCTYFLKSISCVIVLSN